MPRFGWKCFIGSFLFSLTAVFASTKIYLLLLPAEEDKTETVSAFDNIEPRNIDLFANSEEPNPIVQKFEELNQNISLSAQPQTAAAEPEQPEIQTASADLKITDDKSWAEEHKDIPVFDTFADTVIENEEAVLYAPDEDTDNQNSMPTAASENHSDAITADNTVLDDTPAEIADIDTGEPLQIADASEAKPFTIPLQHNFAHTPQNIEVSHEASASQVALASDNVLIQNLGTTDKPALNSTAPSQENSISAASAPAEEDSPWNVAAVGNNHITKNKLKNFAADNLDEVEALNRDKFTAAKSDNEQHVAYKMVKNILIPIPEDIANDENLTPQLSYSEENKKLSEKLKKQGTLAVEPTENITNTENADAPKKKDEETPVQQTPVTPQKTAPSLTDSIAAWFSSSPSPKDTAAENTAAESDKSEDSTQSAFGKLLGLGVKKEIAPSELKLSFQPNRAEISGQTLEWLKAFSLNSVNNDDVFIEIRIDGSSSFELQQKRLNLLYSILINNGVDYNKINIIFTDREPNSFIIRNVRYASEADAEKNRKKAYNPWY